MTVPMNPAVRSRWIAALTSGKYTQCGEQLAHNGAYCCLGVLCEVALADGVGEGYYGSDAYPSDSVLEWAGLSSEDAETCATWNDDDGLSFAEIAARLA